MKTLERGIGDLEPGRDIRGEKRNFSKSELISVVSRVYSRNPESKYTLLTVNGNPILKKELWFSPRVSDGYFWALDKLSEQIIGKNNFSNFPLIRTKGVHSLDRPHDYSFFPRVYLLRSHYFENFSKIVKEMSGDTVFEMLKEREAPQNYDLHQFEKIHKKKISPLITEPKTWTINNEILENITYFFMPTTLNENPDPLPAIDFD